jgi:Leucine-rich repeat (LRR) protein
VLLQLPLMGNVLADCFGARSREASHPLHSRNEDESAQRWLQTGVASVQSIHWDRAVPQLLKHGERVRVLYARHSGVKTFPSSLLEHLRSLERLDLSENELVTVPAALLYALPRLWSLNLARNAIGDLHTTEHRANLSVQAQHEPDPVSGVKPTSPLQWLSLSDNRLPCVPDACRNSVFPRLRYLNLAGNRISSLPKWLSKSFPALEVLILSRNELQTLNIESLRGLQNLRQLCLDHNRLESLPVDLFIELGALQRLELEGNRGHLAEAPTAALSEMVGFADFDQRRRQVQNKRLSATAS